MRLVCPLNGSQSSADIETVRNESCELSSSAFLLPWYFRVFPASTFPEAFLKKFFKELWKKLKLRF